MPHMPSTADGVLTGQPGAATRNLIQQNHGAPDKHSDASCHHRTLIKENTTDTPSLLWRTRFPSPPPPPPNSQHQNEREGMEWEDFRREN